MMDRQGLQLGNLFGADCCQMILPRTRRKKERPAVVLVRRMLSNELAHPVGVCVEFTWSRNMINTINAIYSSLFIQSHYIIILILTGRPLAQQLPVVAGNCHDDHLRFEYNC